MSSLKTYWIQVCVDLDRTVPADLSDDDDGPIVGYYKNYSVTATSEGEALELVAGTISDGTIDWSESRVSSDVVDRLDPTILLKAGDWSTEGIWYETGRVFFPEG